MYKRQALRKGHGNLSPGIVLNINTPDLPENEIKGLRFTTLGNREYKEFFAPVDMGDGTKGYRYNGEPVVYEGLPGSIDVIAIQDGYCLLYTSGSRKEEYPGSAER